MRQRVAFLRTLLPGRPLLLLDEPFASLDSLTRAEMQSWLAEALEAEPRTTLLVTHDVEEALYLADRVAVMSPRPGRVVAELEVPLPRPRAAARDGHRPGVRRAQGAGAGGARPMRRALPALGLLLLALAAWWWVASWDSVDDLLLASPSETGRRCATTASSCSTTPG